MRDELKLAQKLVRRYHTNDPFEICENLGYIVLMVPLKGVRGFYQQKIRNRIIYIDQNQPEHIQRWVCAHELGHALMHDGTNAIYLDSHTYQVVGKFERSADRFAAALLCPDEEELEDYEGYSAEQLSALLGVPTELVSWRYMQAKKEKQ